MPISFLSSRQPTSSRNCKSDLQCWLMTMKAFSPSAGVFISWTVFVHQFHMGLPPIWRILTPSQFWKVMPFKASFNPPESLLSSLKLFSDWSTSSTSGYWCFSNILNANHSFMCSSAAPCQLNHLPLFTSDNLCLHDSRCAGRSWKRLATSSLEQMREPVSRPIR